MSDIITLLNSGIMLNAPTTHSQNEVENAENALSVKFSDEYKKYLLDIGFAVITGHELTGLCKAKRLNVIDVTLTERNITVDIPTQWYVIEQLNIDGIVIWQDNTGAVYQTSPNTKPKKISDSLAEYIEL